MHLNPSRPPRCWVQPCASCQHTCASVTKQYNLVPANGRWCLAAGKITVGLALHWPCVRDISGSPPTGSRPRRWRWAPAYTLSWSMVNFILPSTWVIWCCWLAVVNNIRPVRMLVVYCCCCMRCCWCVSVVQCQWSTVAVVVCMRCCWCVSAEQWQWVKSAAFSVTISSGKTSVWV